MWALNTTAYSVIVALVHPRDVSIDNFDTNFKYSATVALQQVWPVVGLESYSFRVLRR
jgi:hypothetical protein